MQTQADHHQHHIAMASLEKPLAEALKQWEVHLLLVMMAVVVMEVEVAEKREEVEVVAAKMKAHGHPQQGSERKMLSWNA